MPAFDFVQTQRFLSSRPLRSPASRSSPIWRQSMHTNRMAPSCICVWTKSNAGMGSFYRSAHELVFVFKHGEAAHQNNFELGQHGRSRSNVWPYRGVNTFGRDRMELLGVHPTVKPMLMIADALKDVSRRGDLVFDPFLGSGSTLLAAEETGRICLGVELDPGYVEVAIRRWEKRTRRDAVHADTSQTFSCLCEQATPPAPDSM